MKRHIAVEGGGFSGLAAAYELFNHGFAVMVLEARQRVGGRVWSIELPNGAIVELGGEWISSADKNAFKMARRLDLTLVQTGVDFRIRNVVNEPPVSRDDQRKTIQIAAESLAAMDKSLLNQSNVVEFLDDLPVSKSQRTLLSSRLQGSFGADLHDIALRMLGQFSIGESRDYYRIAAGNQSLATTLATRLPDVRLGDVATAVTHHQNGASIKGEAAHGAFDIDADAVILAIPVKRLADIESSPILPQAIGDAISSVPMGVAAKLVIGTQNSPPLFAVQDVEMPYWCWTGRGESGVPKSAVTAFCGSGQAQHRLSTDSDDPSIWFSKLQAANPDLDFVDDPIMVDWSQDEWARGCYSAFDNRAADLIPFLSQHVGRIFFAGEHTAVESGTMEGALASGLNAARQISEVFR
jgi:monoamine oxidase